MLFFTTWRLVALERMVVVQVMLMSREEIKFMVAARRYREVLCALG